MTVLNCYGENSFTFSIFSALAKDNGMGIRNILLPNLKSIKNNRRLVFGHDISNSELVVWLFPSFGKGAGFGEPDAVIFIDGHSFWFEVETFIDFRRPFSKTIHSLRQLLRFRMFANAVSYGPTSRNQNKPHRAIVGYTFSDNGKPRDAVIRIAGHKALRVMLPDIRSSFKRGTDNYVIMSKRKPAGISKRSIRIYSDVINSHYSELNMLLNDIGVRSDKWPKPHMNKYWYVYWEGDLKRKMSVNPLIDNGYQDIKVFLRIMRADRLLSILLMLDKKGKVTAPELAREFEVSVRTIYRDFDALTPYFPIIADSGSDGGFTLMPGYKLPNIAFLSRKDVMALHLMGSVAGQKLGLIPGRDFKGAYLKLYSNLNKMYGDEDRRLAERLVIDIEPWNTPPSVPQVIDALRNACAGDLVVKFDYTKREGKTEKQEVEPYGLCFRSGFWYLVGFSRKRKGYRLFRTDRISKIKVSDRKFQRDPEFKLDRFWNEEFPRQYREKGFPVRILFDRSVVNEVKSKKWGGGEAKTLPDGRLEFNFKTFDLRGLISFVLSFGPKAELIEPANLRDKIREALQGTMQKYK